MRIRWLENFCAECFHSVYEIVKLDLLEYRINIECLNCGKVKYVEIDSIKPTKDPDILKHPKATKKRDIKDNIDINIDLSKRKNLSEYLVLRYSKENNIKI